MTRSLTLLFRSVILAALALGIHAGSSAAEEPPQPTTYRFDILVVRMPNVRESEVLSRPSVITLDRQEAAIQVEEVEQIAIEKGEVISIESGVTCRITPYRLKDGTVKLDIEAGIVESDGRVDDEASAQKIGVRRIQEVPQVDSEITARRAAARDASRGGNEFAPEFPRRWKTEDLRRIRDEWERMWFEEVPMPKDDPPFRTHGGIISYRGGV